jgi:hypothetical protein
LGYGHAGARKLLEEAEKCFAWACLRSQLKGLAHLRQSIDTIESTATADDMLKVRAPYRLTRMVASRRPACAVMLQGVALQLVPVSRKSFPKMEATLTKAEELFANAKVGTYTLVTR